MQKRKRIKQISVTNLFGVFNHTIPLHLDERITIIHGPNGFGKTVILKLLNALFNRDNQLLTIPFDEFRVNFDDDTSFWVTKGNQDEIELNSIEDLMISQEITFCMTDQKPFTATLMYFTYNNSPIDINLNSSIRRSNRITAEFSSYSILKDIIAKDITTKDIIRLLQTGSNQKHLSPDKEPDWLVELRRTISIHLIETQRL